MLENLRSKRITVLGKSISVLTAVLLIGAMGSVGAVLVGYISNTVTADVEVESPMVVGMSLGRTSWATAQCWRYTDPSGLVDCFPEGVDANDNPISDWDAGDWAVTPLTIPSIHGGDIITLYTMSANVADAEIIGHEEIIVASPGITCGDFESITSRFDSIYGDLGYGKLHTDVPGGDCYQIDYGHIEIWSPTDTSTWGAGETDVAKWVITFKTDAKGTYTFTYRVVPV